MSTAATVTIAAPFLWAGAVLAISFIEAPLKFRAPGITIPLGLGIGRLVFGALSVLEVVLAVATIVAASIADVGATTMRLAWAVAALLGLQLLLRVPLDRRTRRVIAGDVAPGSPLHLVYIGLEVVKLALLLTLGVLAVDALV
jgi:hypothetical protein